MPRQLPFSPRAHLHHHHHRSPHPLRARLHSYSSSSSKPPPLPPPPPKGGGGRTIPGPSWAWIEPLSAPFRVYGSMQSRSPYMTQLSTSLVIYFLGDLSAQLVAARHRPDPPNAGKQEQREIEDGGDGEGGAAEAKKAYMYAPERGLRAMVIGGVSAIPSYHWFLFLGRNFNYASSRSLGLAVKILVNQTLFTPLFNAYFFAMHALLSGETLAGTARRVAETVPTSWRMSWRVWPAVTAFSFTFVPPQYRSSFAGVVAIGWQTYLSWLNSRVAREKGAGEDGARGEG